MLCKITVITLLFDVGCACVNIGEKHKENMARRSQVVEAAAPFIPRSHTVQNHREVSSFVQI